MKAEKMYAMAEAPCCEEQEVHADKVQFVNENMPSEDELYDLADDHVRTIISMGLEHINE